MSTSQQQNIHSRNWNLKTYRSEYRFESLCKTKRIGTAKNSKRTRIAMPWKGVIKNAR